MSRGMLERSDMRRDMEIWQHRQEIERLERRYERSGFHKDKYVWGYQQKIEHLEREYERSGFHTDKEVWKHQQEIDLLEREGEKSDFDFIRTWRFGSINKRLIVLGVSSRGPIGRPPNRASSHPSHHKNRSR